MHQFRPTTTLLHIVLFSHVASLIAEFFKYLVVIVSLLTSYLFMAGQSEDVIDPPSEALNPTFGPPNTGKVYDSPSLSKFRKHMYSQLV